MELAPSTIGSSPDGPPPAASRGRYELVAPHGPRDEAAAEDAGFGFRGVQDAGLAGGDAFFRSVEHDTGNAVDDSETAEDRFAGRADARQHGPAYVAGGFDGRGGADPVRFLQRQRMRQQRLARADDHLAAVGVDLHHEQRVAHGDVQAAALADGVT